MNFTVHSGHTQSKEASSSGETSCNFSEMVSKMKKFQLHDTKNVRAHFLDKGMRLFYELNDNLKAYKQGFEKERVLSDEYKQNPIMHKNGEKFEFSSVDQFDFRQWEQYDIIQFDTTGNYEKSVGGYNKSQNNEVNEISFEHIPEYIVDDVSTDKNPDLNIKNIQCFKSGIKIGSKITNQHHRWVEKWFEIHCRDLRVRSSK